MKWTVWELELTPEEARGLMNLANRNSNNTKIQPVKRQDASGPSDASDGGNRPKGRISLMVLMALKKGPMNVREVAQAINHDPQKTSAVLTYLKTRGLVDLLPDKRWRVAARNEDV